MKKETRDLATDKTSLWEKKHRNQNVEKRCERRRTLHAETENRHADCSGRSSRKAIERNQFEERTSRVHTRPANIKDLRQSENNDSRRKSKPKSGLKLNQIYIF